MQAKAREILLSRDRYSYVDTLALIDQKGAEVSHVDEDGIIVKLGDLWSVANFTHWSRLLPYIDTGNRLLCVHDEDFKNYLMANYGYRNEEGCYSYSWWGGEMEVPDCDARVLDPSFVDAIDPFYELADREEILCDLEKGKVTGLFVEGKLVGFIGFHSEGSMGMLHIYEEYRKHGYGEMLERLNINRALSLGMIPYCHVFFSNTASQHLQAKLGLVRGEKPVWWIWKD